MEMTRDPVQVDVVDSSHVAEVRRLGSALAGALGFPEEQRARFALAITEVATNLLKHARGGQILLRSVKGGGGQGVELLALDSGPGMADPQRCLEDGYSTAGSPGTGLGAIRRSTQEFDLYSRVGGGTVLVARIWAKPPDPTALRTGGICVPKPGEELSGDAWGRVDLADRAVILVADGLGHGPYAADASREAVGVLAAEAGRGVEAVMEAAHRRLRSTRGAAVGIAELRRDSVTFAGVGNIAAAVVGPGQSRHLVSHNGTVGHEMRKLQSFTVPLDKEGMLILHSDGLGTQWDLGRYPGLLRRDPSVIAGVLYRDFSRRRDDVTVVAARWPEAK